MEEIAKGFTSKQYDIIERIVQRHIHDWKADRRFQENLSKSNRSFNLAFRLSVLISSTVIAMCIITAIIFM